MNRRMVIGGVVILLCFLVVVVFVMMRSGKDETPTTGPSTQVKTSGKDETPTTEPSTQAKTSGKDETPTTEPLTQAKTSALPPPPPPPSYIEVFGVDYPGNDIKHIPNTTVENCKAECDANPACTLITTNNNGDLCWLKSGAKNMVTHGDRRNYFKPNGPWDVNDNFKLVRAGALCTGNASYSSAAWALLKSGEPRKIAEWNSEGDKLYKTYIERGLSECDKDPNCKYVNVWRDAGYRKYDGSNCPNQRRDDWTSAFKKL